MKIRAHPTEPLIATAGLKRIGGVRYMALFKYALPFGLYAAVCAWMVADESKKPRPDYATLAVTFVIVAPGCKNCSRAASSKGSRFA